MDLSVGDNAIYEFGPFHLDPVRRRLMRDGERIALTSTQFGVLLALVGNAGRVVEKDEILSAVWQGRIIEEGNISQTVFLLRRALKAGGQDGAIETVPGRGYRFAADVRRLTGDAAGRRSEPMPMPSFSHATRLAKLTPPRLPDTLPRPRLFKQLEDAIQRKIVWVVAPPGAGKTTLVASFLEATGRSCIWYVVDAGDSDPASFFYYLREAAAPSARQADLPLFTTEYRADLPGFTRRFIRALIQRQDTPLLLVLDNYQEAANSPALADIIRNLAEELGPDASLIVISRDDPPPTLARMRANQAMTLIGWDDVRLTGAETSDIVLRHDTGLAARAASLHERCAGWAAGLTLLLQSQSLDTEVSAPAVIETPEALFDYFATELARSVTPDVRTVLLSTAYLTRFTTAAAAALSGQQDAPAIIERLARRRVFTDRHATAQVHYRYHALFREYLLRQIADLRSAEERQDLMLRSARAAEQDGDIETALFLYETVGAWPNAATLVLSQASSLFEQGRWQTLQAMVLRHPPEIRDSQPWLLYWLGACTTQADPLRGLAILETAHKEFVKTDDLTGQLLAACAIVESHLVAWGRFVSVLEWIEILERMASAYKDWPSPQMELRVNSVMLRAFANFSPQHGLFQTCVQRVRELCRTEVASGERLMGASALVLSLAMSSSVVSTQQAIAEFGFLEKRPEVSPLQRFSWLTSVGFGSGGDFKSWGSAWQTMGDAALEAGLHFAAPLGRQMAVWQPLIEGRLKHAEAQLMAIEPYLANGGIMVVPFQHCLWAWLFLLQGKTTRALERAEIFEAMALSRDTRRVVSGCVYARALADNGKLEQARLVATEAAHWHGTSSESMFHFAAALTLADILRRLDDRPAYLTTLTDAFATARRGGHLAAPPWFPASLPRLTADALSEGIEVEYVQLVMRTHNIRQDQPFGS
jgi:DNA-binding winged helix-turn-helix (wHTH) protein